MSSVAQCDPSSLPEVLRLSLNSGGSGRGMTHWATASRCGKQALLYEERAERWRREPRDMPSFDPAKKTAFAVGGIYHKLHEMWRKGELDCYGDLSKVVSDDASVALGLHLFKGWSKYWPKNFWGEPVAIEQTLPLSEWAADTITNLFGEVINAKPDMVTYIGTDDLERVQTRVPEITRAGYYMIDFKTAGSEYDRIYYAEGIQSYWYPLAWELDNPDKPIEGFIYDLIYKPNPRAKDQSIGVGSFPEPVYVPYHGQDVIVQTIRGLIEQGRANIERARVEKLGNRSECIKIAFGKVEKCPFYGRECAGR